MTPDLDSLRAHLTRLLQWKDAHAGFDAAVADVPASLRGTRPTGAEHSVWQLLEHARLAQHDIIDFCINPAYQELTWPDDYWPADPAPPDAAAWERSITAFRADRQAFVDLVNDPERDLFARI